MTGAVQVDIVSDVVCPWCWLGKRRFDAAVKEAPFPVEVVWRPYELDPDVPREGVPYAEYMAKKFDGAAKERLAGMRAHLQTAGAAEGVPYNFEGIQKRVNSLNAHRVMRWAQGQGKGAGMAEALFSAYFADGRDLGDSAVLTEIAAGAGLDAEIVGDLLASDRDERQVREEIEFFRSLGVSGVPTFIFNGRFAVTGAQEIPVLVNALKKAYTEGPLEEEA